MDDLIAKVFVDRSKIHYIVMEISTDDKYPVVAEIIGDSSKQFKFREAYVRRNIRAII